MELHLRIIGCLLIAISLLHFTFPRYFQWKTDLAPISLINRQLMYVHSFFIAFIVFLIGILCLCSYADLMYTRLGHQLSFGLFIFWVARLVFQFFVYSPTLWKGKKLELTVHILFSLLWAYFSTIFFLASRMN